MSHRSMSASVLERALPEKTSTAGYLIRVSRPRFWLYLAGPVMIGAVYAADSPSQLFDPFLVALFVYFLVPANVFLYGVNDVFDADIDAKNPKKDGREVRYREDRLVPIAVVLTGILGLAFVPVMPAVGAVAMVTFLFLAAEYSASPLRFKTTPFLDSISNGLYLLPGVVAYAVVSGTAPPAAAIVGGWLWTMGMHTFSAIPDIDPDREAGIETTATWLGETRTYAYCALCWVAAAILFGSLHPFFAVIFGIYPAFIAFVAVSEISVERAYWWFPALNTLSGGALTLAGLWVMLYG